MLGVLVAVFISGPKPARPPAAAVKPVPLAIRTGEKRDDLRPFERLLQGWTVAEALPLVIKPEFKDGLAAAFSLKF